MAFLLFCLFYFALNFKLIEWIKQNIIMKTEKERKIDNRGREKWRELERYREIDRYIE